jgi:uncharacterized protein YbcV (DUF1398 family)
MKTPEEMEDWVQLQVKSFLEEAEKAGYYKGILDFLNSSRTYRTKDGEIVIYTNEQSIMKLLEK